MSKRKRLLFALAAAGLSGVALFSWLWLAEPEHGLTPEVAARIRNGMKLEEVEAIIGMPPGFYRPDMVQGNGRQEHKAPLKLQHNETVIWAHETAFWLFEDAQIIVHLDDKERVVDTQIHFSTRVNRMWRRLTRHIRLPGDW